MGQYDESVALLSQSKYQKTVARSSSWRFRANGCANTAPPCRVTKTACFSPAEKKRSMFFRMAKVYEEMGQKDRAMQCYEKNMAEYPGDQRNQEQLAMLLLQAGQFQQAPAASRKSRCAARRKADFQEKCSARALRGRGTGSLRSTWYRQYLDAAPADSTAWCELGSVFFQQEHYQEAIEALKRKSIALQRKMPNASSCSAPATASSTT